jgi:hypothetical protein
MVAQNIVEEEQEIEEPPKQIALSTRDAEAFFRAIEGTPNINPKMTEMIRRAREFQERHHVEIIK